jgi:cytochrome c-type biogenesis protein
VEARQQVEGFPYVRIDDVGPVAYLVAFAGGIVSFLSPCVLPLVPGYMSLLTGLEIGDLRGREHRHTGQIVRSTGLFVAGFGTVFVALGLSATTIGRVVFHSQILLTRLSGVLLLTMALFMIGSLTLRAPWLYQEARFHPDYGRYGRFAPVVVGAAFGFGWTPCIGPVLGSILGIAATQGRASAGATLLAVYSIGLGIPFLVTGLALSRLTTAFDRIKRHMHALVLTSAVSLGGFGVLLVFNQLAWVTSRMQDGLGAMGLDRLINLG